MAPRRWPALLLAIGVLGCGAVLPKSASSDFFLLTALEPAPNATATTPGPAAAAPSILIGPVVLPEYLDRPEIVTRLASNQLRVADLELWAEPLRESFPRTVEQNLTMLLASSRIQPRPWTGSSPPDLVVSVEVRRFEKTSGGKVELAARWTIRDGSDQTERLRRETRLWYAPPGPSTRAAVASMSQAVAALSREIARGVVQCLARSQKGSAAPANVEGCSGRTGAAARCAMEAAPLAGAPCL
jgi:uncharacterized protein